VWLGWLVEEAARRGVASDERGRMVKAEGFARLEAEITARICEPVEPLPAT
jgi:hypothetical protein